MYVYFSRARIVVNFYTLNIKNIYTGLIVVYIVVKIKLEITIYYIIDVKISNTRHNFIHKQPTIKFVLN